VKVAIQGYNGSFHHQVASNLKLDSDLVFCESFPELFQVMQDSKADLAIVAIENSIAGSILENFDRIRKSGLSIVGEYYLRIVMNLIAYPGQSISDITEVRSHPMALKQCEDFLLAHPRLHPTVDVDTAKVVEEIMEKKLMGVAGIAGEKAAFAFKAEILQSGIETDPQNYTRFMIVAPQGVKVELSYPQKEQLKTSLYVQTKHESGALVKALQVLQSIEANMTNLVSRPVLGRPWHYGFYIDFESDLSTLKKVSPLLRHTSEDFKILGTYPAFN
jgi:prephenate dehydratase